MLGTWINAILQAPLAWCDEWLHNARGSRYAEVFINLLP
jgi:hypothetical protein